MSETSTSATILDLERLRVEVARTGAQPVRGVNMSLRQGETLAVVGESGSGKTLTVLSVIGLLPTGTRIADGSIRFGPTDLAHADDETRRRLRGEQLAMVFQNPMSALNPCFTVGSQIAEPLRRRRRETRRTARSHAVELMRQVGIPEANVRFDAYPHEFSGGMRQRVMIAMALALEPSVLLADEPTTALDVTVQAQILRLLAERARAAELAMMLVSHDLGVVARVANRVAVMYAGRVVEQGPVPEVYGRPAHPYTVGLLDAVPTSRGSRSAGTSTGTAPTRRLAAIPGQAPDPASLPVGCAYHPRCPLATEICREHPPEPRALPDGRMVECHHAEDVPDRTELSTP